MFYSLTSEGRLHSSCVFCVNFHVTSDVNGYVELGVHCEDSTP